MLFPHPSKRLASPAPSDGAGGSVRPVWSESNFSPSSLRPTAGRCVEAASVIAARGVSSWHEDRIVKQV